MNSDGTVIRVEGLCTAFRQGNGTVRAVDGVEREAGIFYANTSFFKLNDAFYDLGVFCDYGKLWEFLYDFGGGAKKHSQVGFEQHGGVIVGISHRYDRKVQLLESQDSVSLSLIEAHRIA